MSVSETQSPATRVCGERKAITPETVRESKYEGARKQEEGSRKYRKHHTGNTTQETPHRKHHTGNTTQGIPHRKHHRS